MIEKMGYLLVCSDYQECMTYLCGESSDEPEDFSYPQDLSCINCNYLEGHIFSSEKGSNYNVGCDMLVTMIVIIQKIPSI